MTTDLPANTRPPQPSDAFAMAMAGVKTIVGVARVDGHDRYVVPVESHPGFRTPRPSDVYGMHAAGIREIRGAIETKQGTTFVKPEDRSCVL